MVNDIVFSDPHIKESRLEELESIFTEIASYSKTHKRLICLGDFFNSKKPTPAEIYFATSWAKYFTDIFNEFIIVRGNHEETSTDLSSLNYLEFLGVKIVDEYTDGKLFYGHFFTELSDSGSMRYDKYTRDHTAYLKYDVVLLGHQHSYQKVTSNIYHIGSCCWISFNEVDNQFKYIVANNNYKLSMIPLTSPIKMIDVDSVEKLNLINSSNYKVRYVFKSFEQFKNEIDQLTKYKNKYKEFKIKLDFKKEKSNSNSKSSFNNKNFIDNWINNIDDEDVRGEIQDVFK